MKTLHQLNPEHLEECRALAEGGARLTADDQAQARARLAAIRKPDAPAFVPNIIPFPVAALKAGSRRQQRLEDVHCRARPRPKTQQQINGLNGIIIEYARRVGPFHAKDLERSVEGMNFSTCRSSLMRLYDAGILQRTGRGGRHHPYTYTLTGQADDRMAG